ncbi:MAG: response regulator [Candidatus Omnitrophica bacterium]|nr:response regulator [Candidatus Omnitrophota bacterium]
MKKIWMIEDNEDHALLIKRGIEDENCAATHFSDPLEALKACKEVQTQDQKPDLILLDLKLPGMDGFEVLKNLKQLKWFERVPIIMLSTSSRKEEIQTAYQLGVSGYVVKSEDFGNLTAKLKRIKDYWFHTVEIPNQVAG